LILRFPAEGRLRPVGAASSVRAVLLAVSIGGGLLI
jgi:hypothetical protein